MWIAFFVFVVLIGVLSVLVLGCCCLWWWYWCCCCCYAAIVIMGTRGERRQRLSPRERQELARVLVDSVEGALADAGEDLAARGLAATTAVLFHGPSDACHRVPPPFTAFHRILLNVCYHACPAGRGRAATRADADDGG